MLQGYPERSCSGGRLWRGWTFKPSCLTMIASASCFAFSSPPPNNRNNLLGDAGSLARPLIASPAPNPSLSGERSNALLRASSRSLFPVRHCRENRIESAAVAESLIESDIFGHEGGPSVTRRSRARRVQGPTTRERSFCTVMRCASGIVFSLRPVMQPDVANRRSMAKAMSRDEIFRVNRQLKLTGSWALGHTREIENEREVS